MEITRPELQGLNLSSSGQVAYRRSPSLAPFWAPLEARARTPFAVKMRRVEIPGYPERKRVLRLLDESSRAKILVSRVRSLVAGLRRFSVQGSVAGSVQGSVGGAGADHVYSENEKCQNASEAY